MNRPRQRSMQPTRVWERSNSRRRVGPSARKTAASQARYPRAGLAICTPCGCIRAACERARPLDSEQCHGRVQTGPIAATLSPWRCVTRISVESRLGCQPAYRRPESAWPKVQSPLWRPSCWAAFSAASAPIGTLPGRYRKRAAPITGNDRRGQKPLHEGSIAWRAFRREATAAGWFNSPMNPANQNRFPGNAPAGWRASDKGFLSMSVTEYIAIAGLDRSPGGAWQVGGYACRNTRCA